MSLFDRILVDNLTLGLSLTLVILFVLMATFFFLWRGARNNAEKWAIAYKDSHYERRDLNRELRDTRQALFNLQLESTHEVAVQEATRELMEMYKTMEGA